MACPDGFAIRDELAAHCSGDSGGYVLTADAGDNGDRLGDVPGLNTEFDLPGKLRGDGIGGEDSSEFRARGGVVEVGEAEGGAAADHGGGIAEQGEQGLMKFRGGGIFTHEPGNGPAEVRIGVFRQREHTRVVRPHGLVVAAQFFSHLQEHLRGVRGAYGEGERFRDPGRVEGPAEPGEKPEEERPHQEQRSGGDTHQHEPLRGSFRRQKTGENNGARHGHLSASIGGKGRML